MFIEAERQERGEKVRRRRWGEKPKKNKNKKVKGEKKQTRKADLKRGKKMKVVGVG